MIAYVAECDWCGAETADPAPCDVGHCLGCMGECRRCQEILAEDEAAELAVTAAREEW